MNYAIAALLLIYSVVQFVLKLSNPAPADHSTAIIVINLGLNGIACLAIMALGWRQRQRGLLDGSALLNRAWPHFVLPCVTFLLVLAHELGGALNIYAGVGFLILAGYVAAMLVVIQRRPNNG